MTRAIAFVALLALAACDAQVTRQQVDLGKLSYQRDSRTGECFAVLGHRAPLDFKSAAISISWVPCTDRIRQAILDDAGR